MRHRSTGARPDRVSSQSNKPFSLVISQDARGRPSVDVAARGGGEVAYERLSDGQLDYQPCRYGASRLLFRGPQKTLEGDYLAFLGGTETYGRFVPRPFPDLVADVLGMASVNLGCVNAGVDVFAQDAVVKSICARARVTVIQVMGAANMSNRMYTVHPRRNDRFVRASGRLTGLYPQIDFTQFHFTRHLLRELRMHSPGNFRLIEEELRMAWLARMRGLIRDIGGNVVLVWLSRRSPDESHEIDFASEPLFVCEEMLGNLAEMVRDVLMIRLFPAKHKSCLAGMVYSDVEAPIAAELPGAEAHRNISESLAPCLAACLGEE